MYVGLLQRKKRIKTILMKLETQIKSILRIPVKKDCKCHLSFDNLNRREQSRGRLLVIYKLIDAYQT